MCCGAVAWCRTPCGPLLLQVLWAKGYTELLDRLKEHTQRTGQSIAVDVYGSGPDLKVGAEGESRKRRAGRAGREGEGGQSGGGRDMGFGGSRSAGGGLGSCGMEDEAGQG